MRRSSLEGSDRGAGLTSEGKAGGLRECRGAEAPSRCADSVGGTPEDNWLSAGSTPCPAWVWGRAVGGSARRRAAWMDLERDYMDLEEHPVSAAPQTRNPKLG